MAQSTRFDLPDEIWCSIWLELDLSARLRVMMVCRAWRHLAINTALLWQQLQLSVELNSIGERAQSNVAAIRRALQLTHRAALDITVNFTLVSARVSILQVGAVLDIFVNYLAPYIGQVRTLAVNSNDARASQSLWRAIGLGIGTTGAPQFNNLCRISCRFSGNETQEKSHFTFLGGPQEAYRSGWITSPRLTVLEAPCGLFAVSSGSLGRMNLTDITIGVSNVNEIVEVMKCPTIRTARLLLRYYDFIREVPAPFKLSRRAQELESLHFDQLPWKIETCAEDDYVYNGELERAARHRRLVWRVLLWPRAARVHQLTYDTSPATFPDLGFALFSSIGETKSLALIVSWSEIISITAVEIDDANSFTVPFDDLPGRRHGMTFDGNDAYYVFERVWPKLRVNSVSVLCIDIPDGWEVQWGELPVCNLEPLPSVTRFVAITKRRENLVASLKSSELEAWQAILPAVESLSFLERNNNRTDDGWEFSSWAHASTKLERARQS